MSHLYSDFIDDPAPGASKAAAAEGKVKYVLSGQPSGWAAMAQVVRDFDQEKVQECKEDIDTLLVFAGLFSAILSAFLVATYPDLQEDPADRMLQVLERIAAQTSSYTIHSNTLNSTLASTAFAHAPFQPSTNDIRVNVLWFASLIISLTTASFGILVKQWLREYMAVENPSPQARLRVRHVRYPELKRWKVFEIAAALPLLLQIALGLFFLGLCYLTASVHASVASATLPLVIGWAVCFISVTLMPILFPRCPFKTTFLKSVLLFTRQTTVYFIFACYYLVIHFPVNALHLSFRIWLTDHVTAPFGVATHNAATNNDFEKRAVSVHTADASILAAVDAIQFNDELLATTIKDSLLQADPSLDTSLKFVSVVIKNRLRDVHVLPKTGYPQMSNVASLSFQAKTAITDILCPAVTSFVAVAESNGINYFHSPAYISAFAILLSSSSPDFPPRALEILRSGMLLDGPTISRAIARTCVPSPESSAYRNNAEKADEHGSKVSLLLEGLTSLLPKVDLPFHNAFVCFEEIWKVLITRPSDGVVSLSPFQREAFHFEWQWNYHYSSVRYGFVRYLSTIILRELQRVCMKGSDQLSPRTQDALMCWLQMSTTIFFYKQECLVLMEMFRFTSLRSGDTFVSALLAMPQEWYSAVSNAGPHNVVVQSVMRISRQKEGHIWDGILDGLHRTVIDKCANRTSRDFPAKPQVLRLCLFFIWMVILPQSVQYKEKWTRLFHAVVDWICRYDDSSANSAEWAIQCLSAIEDAEHRACGSRNDPIEEAYRRWSDWFLPEKTVFSDYMVEELARVGHHRYSERRRAWSTETLPSSRTSGDKSDGQGASFSVDTHAASAGATAENAGHTFKNAGIMAKLDSDA